MTDWVDLLGAEWARFVLMVFLLAISALFSGSETALFSLTRENLRTLAEDGRLVSAFTVNLMRRPRRTLVAILLGNLAVGIFYFSIGGLLAGRLDSTGALIFSALCLLLYIFVGEFLPKGAAMARPLLFSRLAAIPIWLFSRIILPLSGILHRLAAWISRLLGGATSGEPYVSAEELKAYVRLAGATGRIADDEREMLQDVIEIGRIAVREVLVPRVDMVSIDIDASRQELLDLTREHRVSKVVVVEGSPDRVRGWVAVKDLLFHPSATIRDILREIPAVPETKSVESLLREFRRTGAALALVVDEYGGTEGIVTPEDILEEIVGEIADEYDPETGRIRRLLPGVTILPGELPVREWEERSGIRLPRGRYDTVGGFVMEALGRVPVPGDLAREEGVRFTVLRVRRGRVLSVLADARPGGDR